MKSLVLAAVPGQNVAVLKDETKTPAEQGFRRSIGLVKGQNKDWRLALSNGSGVHVREYDNHYEVHIDTVDPSKSIVKHLAADTPITLLFIYGIVGGFGAYYLKKPPLAGALIGIAAAEFLRTRKL